MNTEDSTSSTSAVTKPAPPFPPPPLLTLQTCIVRPYHPADASNIARHANNPRIAQWMTNMFPHPYTLERAHGWIAMNLPKEAAKDDDGPHPDSDSAAATAATTTTDKLPLAQQLTPTAPTAPLPPQPEITWPATIHYAICIGDECVGGIGVKPGVGEHARSAELGYWLGEAAWGRGIMTEAAAAYADWVFETVPRLERLGGCVYSGNVGSVRVLEKIGFRREGSLRRSVWKGGVWRDLDLFGLLRDEWVEGRGEKREILPTPQVPTEWYSRLSPPKQLLVFIYGTLPFKPCKWRAAINRTADEMLTPSLHLRSALAGAGSLAMLLFLFLGFNDTNTFPQPLKSAPVSSNNPGYLQDVFNRTLGFQKIFVINLPSRTDHRDSMSLAAALTDMEIEYVDGVTEVTERALPPGGKEANLNRAALGSWRAHLNAIRKHHQRIVEQNLTSALILEDDADWDLRIKSQLRDFARASQMLVQPLSGKPDQFLDPTHPSPAAGQEQEPQNFMLDEYSDNGELMAEPTTSPYGDIDRWDVLWLGHCGVRFPRGASSPASDATANTRPPSLLPLGRVVMANDPTVPEPQHVDKQFGSDELRQQYPAHTRVVSRARQGTCTLGYAVSQPGARRVLYEMGVRRLTGKLDSMLRALCDGGEDVLRAPACLTVQPQLFQHHRPVGAKLAFSDISDHGDGYNSQAFTRNVRWSTRLNFPRLVDGRTDYVDLWRDGEEDPLDSF
ncbi:glycosyltransferase family 25 protein [Diplodia corticola]|uniref:Glycosyltransferase family 25 protein n=1 Tax=Diplodia corticola TaxID=236234 RepID=A0A1J9S3V8_9PEZI|nr:glycosyltransferase family 25 protein [Diplodia corticola]OJD34676.1 glycosyltransferase family 25 protein [Diplodia corticola]